MVSCDGPWEGTVLVDGFNVIISLEVAFSHSPVILAEDGAVRDLAGLQGTYHPIDATGLALEALFSALVRGGTSRCVIYLDQPVSNSGRLAGIIRERAATCAPGLDLEVELMKNPDALLSGRELVISNDSYVLDACKSWIPLERTIVCGISDAWLLRPIG
jgi:hypothetical protein